MLWLGICLLASALVGAIAAGIYKSLATFSFFERTNADIYTEWLVAEFGRAASFGIPVTAVAAIVFGVLQRRHSRFAIGAPVAAVIVVAALIGAAALSREHRAHPVNQERAIARSVPLPASWGSGTLRVEADPLTDQPPTVGRSLDLALDSPHVCRQLLASLTGWRGAHLVPWGGGGKLGPLTPNLSTGLGCSMHGTTPQGWSVTLSAFVHPTNARLRSDALGNVPVGMTRVFIRVGTPD